MRPFPHIAKQYNSLFLPKYRTRGRRKIKRERKSCLCKVNPIPYFPFLISLPSLPSLPHKSHPSFPSSQGMRTGYIYRKPLIKQDTSRLHSDVALPPTASNYTHLFDEDDITRRCVCVCVCVFCCWLLFIYLILFILFCVLFSFIYSFSRLYFLSVTLIIFLVFFGVLLKNNYISCEIFNWISILHDIYYFH